MKEKMSKKISGGLQLMSGGLKSPLTAPLGACLRCYVTLRRVLAFGNDYVFSPIIPRMPVLVRKKMKRRARRVTRK